jgi:hypothetical protein
MAATYPSALLKLGTRAVLALSLGAALAFAPLQPARASSLSDVLRMMADEYGFTLVGVENAIGVTPRPAAGDLLIRLEAMLQDFNHVIVKDANGRLQKVVVGAHRASAIAGESDKADAKADDADSLASSPVPGAQITSLFGLRRDPIGGNLEEHHGIDLAAPAGTPVRAPAAGRVVEAGYRGGYGNYIRIQHDATFETAYGHLDHFADSILPDARLEAGTIIGYVGASGHVTGAHLHYEILVHGRAIDPWRLIARQPAATAVAGLFLETSAKATASPASVADVDAALRHALAVAYLAERLNAVAQRLPPTERDCSFAACQ